jgi:hypothetical protein
MQSNTNKTTRVYFGNNLGPVIFQYHGGGGVYQYIIELDGTVVADSGPVSGPGQIYFNKESITPYGTLKIIRF